MHPNKKKSYIVKRSNGDYEIRYNRNKPRGKKQKSADSFTLISGEVEIEALDRYIQCFPDPPVKATNGTMNGRTGRFFRYLRTDQKTGKIVSTVMPIGKTPCSKVGLKIAEFLNLPNPENYTGQTWRGTAATLGADAGLYDSELQNITGHRSSSALKVYKANSEPQKQKVATALSLKEKENISSNKKRTRDYVVVAAGSKNVSIILTNSTVTSLTIKQHYVNDDEDDNSEEE